MKIHKILSYDVYANTEGEERYQRVCDLLEQKLEPETQHPGELHCGHHVVYSSPRKRALDCVDESSAASITIHPALNEIPFSFKNYCDLEQFLSLGSTAVRQAFVKAFIADDLLISHNQLQTELSEIIALANSDPAPLCISHTFRMKLIEVCKQVGDQLFTEPDLLQAYIYPSQHLYPFGHIIEI